MLTKSDDLLSHVAVGKRYLETETSLQGVVLDALILVQPELISDLCLRPQLKPNSYEGTADRVAPS